VFSRYVAEKLRHLCISAHRPTERRNSYVGKGNRVFAHAKDELGAAQDVLTEKLSRIRKIRLDGFEVAHVIHRHGLNEEQAFEVEAALIDAYPEVANEVGGKASDERGLMHDEALLRSLFARAQRTNDLRSAAAAEQFCSGGDVRTRRVMIQDRVVVIRRTLSNALREMRK
jgi:uncharacterized protein